MKRICVILALMLLLSGCACSHQWQAADCLQPEICADCGETRGQPRGHAYREATCTLPEQCAVCGECRGEAPGHMLRNWEFQGEEMFRACEVCGWEERTALEREVYLRFLLSGHWECPVKNPSRSDPWFCCTREGEARYYDGSQIRQGTCSLDIYQQTEQGDCYTIVFQGEGETLTLLLREVPAGEPVLTLGTVTLTQHREIAEAMTCKWGAMADGQLYVLTLNPDRTLTLEPGYTGRWQIGDSQIQGDNRSCILLLELTREGESTVHTCQLSLGNRMLSQDNLIYQMNFDLKLEDTLLSFRPRNEAQLQEYRDLLAEGAHRLEGQWQSRYVITDMERFRNHDIWDGYDCRTDMVMEFLPDGSFTAWLDQEYTGTWRLSQVTTMGAKMEYSYALSIQDLPGVWRMTMDEEGYLYLQGNDAVVQLSRPEDPDLAQLLLLDERLVGTWECKNAESFYAYYEEEADRDMRWEPSGGYTLEIREDGTFAAYFDQKESGTWQSVDILEENGAVYQFDFPNSQNNLAFININEALLVNVLRGNRSYTYYLWKDELISGLS